MEKSHSNHGGMVDIERDRKNQIVEEEEDIDVERQQPRGRRTISFDEAETELARARIEKLTIEEKNNKSKDFIYGEQTGKVCKSKILPSGGGSRRRRLQSPPPPSHPEESDEERETEEEWYYLLTEETPSEIGKKKKRRNSEKRAEQVRERKGLLIVSWVTHY